MLINRVHCWADGDPIKIGELVDRGGTWETRWGVITSIEDNLLYAKYGKDIVIYDLDNRGLPVE